MWRDPWHVRVVTKRGHELFQVREVRTAWRNDQARMKQFAIELLCVRQCMLWPGTPVFDGSEIFLLFCPGNANPIGLQILGESDVWKDRGKVDIF